jgi:hypothetical protein
MINTYKILVGKPEGKRPLMRPKQRCDGNIKKDLKIQGVRAWIGFKWLRIWFRAGSSEHGNESQGLKRQESS